MTGVQTCAFRSVSQSRYPMLFSGAVAVVVGFYLLKRNFRYLKGEFDSAFFNDLFIYSWPVGLSNGASRINTNLDTIFLQMYWGSSFTGEYSAVYRLMGFGIMFGNFFTSALYPLICERAVGTKELLGSTLDLSTRILLIFLVPVSVVLMIVGPELVVVLFGNAYEHGGMALRILSWIPLLLLISRLLLLYFLFLLHHSLRFRTLMQDSDPHLLIVVFDFSHLIFL